jgi:hypothetical protein
MNEIIKKNHRREEKERRKDAVLQDDGGCDEQRCRGPQSMHSLQGTVDELGFNEGLAVSDESEVLCDVVFADFLGAKTGHGGCAVANEDAVPVGR